MLNIGHIVTVNSNTGAVEINLILSCLFFAVLISIRPLLGAVTFKGRLWRQKLDPGLKVVVSFQAKPRSLPDTTVCSLVVTRWRPGKSTNGFFYVFALKNRKSNTSRNRDALSGLLWRDENIWTNIFLLSQLHVSF